MHTRWHIWGIVIPNIVNHWSKIQILLSVSYFYFFKAGDLNSSVQATELSVISEVSVNTGASLKVNVEVMSCGGVLLCGRDCSPWSFTLRLMPGPPQSFWAIDISQCLLLLASFGKLLKMKIMTLIPYMDLHMGNYRRMKILFRRPFLRLSVGFIITS